MIRSVAISESKALQLSHSMILISIMTNCAYMEYHNHVLDANFKSPVVHQKLKVIVDNLKFVKDHVRREFMKEGTGLEDTIFDDNILIWEIVQKLINIDHLNLQQLLDNLTEALAQATQTVKEEN
mgnify:CR=1 FL=1